MIYYYKNKWVLLLNGNSHLKPYYCFWIISIWYEYLKQYNYANKWILFSNKSVRLGKKNIYDLNQTFTSFGIK